MPIKEVKTSIKGLEVGMYVCRLDRPWLETPYLMQGMMINSEDDILELKKHCSYVFIDLEQGIAPKSSSWAVGNENDMSLSEQQTSIFNQSAANEYQQYRQCVYETTVELEDELKTAKTVFDNVAEQTRQVFEDLKNKKQLNLIALQSGVKATVNSIIRNPNAMILIAQLRKSDDYSYSHALGTSVWCAQFGRHLGLDKKDINLLALGGMLLDVGKLELPDNLLNHSRRYTSKELDAIKHHVKLGVITLSKVGSIQRMILEMVATHHERADGSGYQLGIKNGKIPLFGRIAGIVDSYDAMTSQRIFTEKTFTPHEAMNELYKMRGTLFQTELVEQFIQTVGLYPTGSLVEMNTGEVGAVTEINDLKRLYPTVMLLLDSNKRPYDEFNIVNLSKVTGMRVEKGLEPGAFGINMDELFL